MADWQSVTYQQGLGASADKAWAVLGDFGSLLHWVRGGDEGTLSLSGDGIGMVRDFTLPSVGAVRHRLDEHDEAEQLFTYSLTSGTPLGMQTYDVTIQLQPAGQGCQIIWTGKFLAEDDAPLEAIAENLQGAYRDMSERLDSYLASL
jgi:hypothetical protein